MTTTKTMTTKLTEASQQFAEDNLLSPMPDDFRLTRLAFLSGAVLATENQYVHQLTEDQIRSLKDEALAIALLKFYPPTGSQLTYFENAVLTGSIMMIAFFAENI